MYKALPTEPNVDVYYSFLPADFAYLVLSMRTALLVQLVSKSSASFVLCPSRLHVHQKERQKL
jgi:hypothetical protein